MDELISREKVIDILETTPLHVTGVRLGKSIASQYADRCRDILVGAVQSVSPEDDVTYIRHGYWINRGKTARGSNILECSVCNKVRKGTNRSMYCRDCGAKMDEEEHV